MPRAAHTRSYRALAISMNRKAWGDLPLPDSLMAHRIVGNAASDLEESAHRQQASWLHARRDRLVKEINRVTHMPNLFWRHRYFRDCRGGLVLSTDEAVAELRAEIARERRRKGHWSHKPERIQTMREAMVFARYFRRFGQRVWMREAA